MFDLVYKNKRVVQVILGLMTIPFAIWGIESYTRVSSRDSVATVNGIDITRRELDERMAGQIEQVRRAFGSQVDPSMFDTPETRRALARRADLPAPGDERGGAATPVHDQGGGDRRHRAGAGVQENGQFSEPRFTAYLASRSLTAERYVVDLQTELPLARLVNSVADARSRPAR